MSRLQDQVLEFHVAFDVPCPGFPTVPPADRVRLRLRLIAEEFLELVAAATNDPDDNGPRIRMERIKSLIGKHMETSVIRVDLPEFIDACGDLDYVVEGSRLEFGVDGLPIADAIHAANMAKLGGPVVDGKIRKPAGWQPPDIAGELRKQGWRQ
jgi:predicted HAD superfamily Cof-like phosphohydrolase